MANASNFRTAVLFILLFRSATGGVATGSSRNCGVGYPNCLHTPGKYQVWLYTFYDTGYPCNGVVSYHTGLGFSDGSNSGYWWFGAANGIANKKICRDDKFNDRGFYSGKYYLGRVYKTLSEVQKIVDRLGGEYGRPCSYVNGRNDCFTGNYNWNSWNCNHFTAWLADELGVWSKYPANVWNLRNIG